MKNRINFIQGHHYLNTEELGEIKKALRSADDRDVTAEYERKMAALTGEGQAVSFAAGRMAFFSLLKILNIGKGDEVILPGFTCSVMVNAVRRAGATPVFSDIDDGTFGSDAGKIEKRITGRTKLVVAQHSFGIPCDIAEIAGIAKKRGIFLVEDCAISLDSSIGGKKAGNWSDAAIFSTDHTKPLNTLIGGLLYTREKSLYEKISAFRNTLPGLDSGHQERLYEQILLEGHLRSKFLARVKRIIGKLKGKAAPVFLESDYAKLPAVSAAYPYPAKMPAFLAGLGLIELGRWNDEKSRRKNILVGYIEIMKNSPLGAYLPKAYSDPGRDITPLRFVFSYPEAEKMAAKMSRFIDTGRFWFKHPVICAAEKIEAMGYIPGSCPTSEAVGARIINWPCVVPDDLKPGILSFFRSIVNDKEVIGIKP